MSSWKRAAARETITSWKTAISHMAPGPNVAPWAMAGAQNGDGVQTSGGLNHLRMKSSPNTYKIVSQTVLVNAHAGDTLVIGGQARAYATADAALMRHFAVYAEIYSTNNTLEDTVLAAFDRFTSMEPQTVAACFPLEIDCYKIVYNFVYLNHAGEVIFDNAFVYVGNYGERYTYDSKGQLENISNDEGEITDLTYDSDANITAIEQTHSGVTNTVAEMEYDGNHNVTKMTNNIGTEIDLTYQNGQVTSQAISDSSASDVTTETMTYIQGGNYLKTYTDASGGVTTYTYDNNDQALKGLVVKVEDPNGNETTYTYDPNTDELLSTGGKTNPLTPVTTSFTTQDYLPKTITRNGTIYSYDYDDQNRVTAAKVGAQTLASSSYDSRQRLAQQSYANGAIYTPMYDSRDRLVGEKWNNVQTAEYFYNENDRLSQTVDKTSGVTYKYDYAFYGLLNKIIGSDGSLTAYDYDMSGKLSHLTFSKNNDILHKARYATSEKGLPEDVILETLGNTALHYNYDGLGRLTGNSTGPLLSLREYHDGPNGTSGLVEQYTNEDGNGIALQQYEYSYDLNGNITEITDTVSNETIYYVYDGLNRLVTEYGSYGMYDYTYDAGGNLTSRARNGVTMETYTYGNSNWKDQLTNFWGDPITYDALGNPLTYLGFTFTWQRGRQLASFSGNGLNIDYTYDASGRRTKQVVNGTAINYTYSGDLLMRQSDGVNTLDFQYDASGNAAGFVYNNTVYYYLRNLQGDVVAITDASGNVVAEYAYDAYGNITNSSGVMASINPIRYRGYYQDPHTGWYFLQTRYYSPDWRRFINADTLFVAGDDALNGSNMYAYCNGNPVMNGDPNGMASTRFGQWWENTFINKPISELNLRDLWPFDMSWAAPVAILLAFERVDVEWYGDTQELMHTTYKNDWNWQRFFGYNPVYDFFFRVGTSMEKEKFPFQANNKYYTVWCWKGDYWNLGAGAEIGIYETNSAIFAALQSYGVNPDNTLAASVYVKHNGQTIITYLAQVNWWVCVFRPSVQQANAKDLDVTIFASFSGPDSNALWNAFYSHYTAPGNQRETLRWDPGQKVFIVHF